jgi:hypothetical protein
LNCIHTIESSLVTPHTILFDFKVSTKSECFRGNASTVFQSIVHLSKELATKNQITWIEPKRQIKLFNKYISGIVQSGGIETPLWAHSLNGEGQIVSIADTGIDYDMCFL